MDVMIKIYPLTGLCLDPTDKPAYVSPDASLIYREMLSGISTATNLTKYTFLQRPHYRAYHNLL